MAGNVRTSRQLVDGRVLRVEIATREAEGEDGAGAVVDVKVTEEREEGGERELFTLEGARVVRREGGLVDVSSDGSHIHGVAAVGAGGDGEVCLDGTRYLLRDADLMEEDDEGAEQAGPRVDAPMPGRVIKVLVEPGAAVEPGMPLLLVESMKMETEIASGIAGAVKVVHVGVGDNINPGDTLVEIEPAE